MKNFLMFFAAIVFLSAIGISKEEMVPLKNLPPAVQKTVQDQIRGAELKGLSKEKENGKTVYEVETIKNGRTRDILIDAAGAVLEIEEAATLDEIPAPARAAIEKSAANGKVKKVEAVTKDSSTCYEAVITKGGRSSEVKVGADGTLIK